MPLYPNITKKTGAAFNGTSLESITITPAGTSISASSTQQFVASGTFKNWSLNSTASYSVQSFVSWSSSNTGYFTINQSGLATWVSASATGTVSATFMTVTGTTTVYTLSPPTQYSIYTWTTASLVHVFVTGAALSATITGSSFTDIGSGPTLVAASGSYPEAFKFATSTGIASVATNDAMDTTADWQAAIIMKYPSNDLSQWIMNENNGSLNAGFRLAVYQPNGNFYYSFDNGGNDDMVLAGGITTADQPLVLLVGKVGARGKRMQINNGTFTSGTNGFDYVQATSDPFRIGAFQGGGGQSMNHPIAEIYIEQVTPTSASFAALYNLAKAKLGSLLP